MVGLERGTRGEEWEGGVGTNRGRGSEESVVDADWKISKRGDCLIFAGIQYATRINMRSRGRISGFVSPRIDIIEI
jgi:hypothetical protein